MAFETKDTESWLTAFQVASTKTEKCVDWETQMTKHFS
jgi:hypothetical protein